MNIIIIKILNGKEGSKLSRQFCCRGANYLAIPMDFCVSLSFTIFELFWRLATAQASLHPSPKLSILGGNRQAHALASVQKW
jgi:hypothetical protein